MSCLVLLTLSGGDAGAQQDLDRDKPAAKLFAANCNACHRSPRGLVKGRFGFTLTSFLQQHYTSSAATARELAAYLQANDAPAGKARPTARKSRPAGSAAAPQGAPPAQPSGAAQSGAPRPPAQVPAGER